MIPIDDKQPTLLFEIYFLFHGVLEPIFGWCEIKRKIEIFVLKKLSFLLFYCVGVSFSITQHRQIHR